MIFEVYYVFLFIYVIGSSTDIHCHESSFFKIMKFSYTKS